MRRIAVFGTVLIAALTAAAGVSADGVSRPKRTVYIKRVYHRVHRPAHPIIVHAAAAGPVLVAVGVAPPPPVPVPRPDYGFFHLNGSGWPGIAESAQDALWVAYFRSPSATGYPPGSSPEQVGEVRYNRGPGPIAHNPPPVAPDRLRIAAAPALFQYDPATGDYVRLAAPEAAMAAAVAPPPPSPPPAAPAWPAPIPLLPAR